MREKNLIKDFKQIVEAQAESDTFFVCYEDVAELLKRHDSLLARIEKLREALLKCGRHSMQQSIFNLVNEAITADDDQGARG